MSNKLNPRIEYLEGNPEVISYINQQIADLQSFVTEQTVISVLSKDPAKLSIQLETEGRAIPARKLKKMYRVAIVLREDDTEIQGEGLDRNIFQAIKQAKEQLLVLLNEIQDEVISNSDRQDQINQVLQNTQVH